MKDTFDFLVVSKRRGVPWTAGIFLESDSLSLPAVERPQFLGSSVEHFDIEAFLEGKHVLDFYTVVFSTCSVHFLLTNRFQVPDQKDIHQKHTFTRVTLRQIMQPKCLTRHVEVLYSIVFIKQDSYCKDDGEKNICCSIKTTFANIQGSTIKE